MSIPSCTGVSWEGVRFLHQPVYRQRLQEQPEQLEALGVR